MGVKTEIFTKDLPAKYQSFELIPTKNGACDSVYLLGNKFVIKIFEDLNYNIESEIELLNNIRDLSVIQFVERFKIDKKHSIVYKQVRGESILSPNNTHIKEIGRFLKEFHTLTRDKTSQNSMIFEKTNIENVIINSGNNIIQKHFENLDLELNNDGIIHGDIFPDNVYFLDDKLSSVLDFSDACNGDFLFDLAVIAISWCYDNEKLNENKLDVLLQNYDKNISKKHFLNYMKYALICYGILRFIHNLNYKQLLNRLEGLDKL